MFTTKESGDKQNRFIIDLEESPEEIFKKLLTQRYSFAALNPQAAIASASSDETDPSVYYVEPQYNAQQLAIIDDAWTNDLVINNATNKFVYGICGKHGRTVLDTTKEFNVEKDRRVEVKKVNDNKRYKVAKQSTDKVLELEDVDFFTNFTDMVEESLVFGRAASVRVNDPMTGILAALIRLDPRRLGRVKVDRASKKILAVEYQDCIVHEGGQVEIALEGANFINEKIEPAWIDINDLIYLPHAFGGVRKNARYVGYSKLEGMIHMSQVKRIIINENAKESSKALYAGTGRMEFDPATPPELMASIIQDIKRAVGRWFGHKAGVVTNVEIHDLKPAIEKFAVLVEMINREMLRGLGLPSFIVGYEQIANYANSEQIMLAMREMDITHIRTRLKDFIKNKVVAPIFFYFLAYGGDPTGQKVASNKLAMATQRLDKLVNIPQDELKQYYERLALDQEVKLVYEFADLSFTTKLELAAMFEKVKAMVPALPSEAILRALGLEDYTEEVAAAEEENKKMAQAIAMQPPPNGKVGGTTSASVSAKEGTQPQRNIAAVASAYASQLTPDEHAELMELIRLQTKIYKQVDASPSS
jgi:hypothetical protein